MNDPANDWISQQLNKHTDDGTRRMGQGREARAPASLLVLCTPRSQGLVSVLSSWGLCHRGCPRNRTLCLFMRR